MIISVALFLPLKIYRISSYTELGHLGVVKEKKINIKDLNPIVIPLIRKSASPKKVLEVIKIFLFLFFEKQFKILFRSKEGTIKYRMK